MSKILVVEDTQDTRELLSLYFKNAGFTIAAAIDGREGFYLAIAEQPDLIITDMAMPNVGGGEMIKMLRAEPTTAKIPIVVFTAHRSVSPQLVEEAGADKIFYKPFDFDELVSNVKALIQ
jgi:DNA-binding response OmpR family regulator